MMNRPRLVLVSVCLIALTIGASAPQPTTLPAFKQPDLTKRTPYPVVRVIDGDTIVVKLDGKDTTVRLIGVDTPETKHPQKPVQYYGKEAARFTGNLLKGEKVYLGRDPQQGKYDRYGRALAYVYRYPDGLFVNAEIIRQGYGHAYTRYPFKRMEGFRKLERFAREAKKGLWGDRPVTTTKPAEVKKPEPRKPVPPVVAPVVKPKPATPSVTVYITRTGKKYHRGSCSYLRRSKIPMKLEDAKRSYGPCSRCGPPR